LAASVKDFTENGRHPMAKPTSKTVLIIDDDPDIVVATRVVLEGGGYAVATASNGKDGLARVRKGGVDCILLDVMMQSATEGFNVAQDLRADPKTAAIPIVMMTSVGEKTGFEFSPAVDGDYLPVDRFLPKPVEPKTLLETIRSVLK
jgi:CheY-like chemotaxis protein